MATVEYLDFGQSPICLVDSTGIHRPPFEDIIAYLESGMRLIFGADLYLDSDSQDGQFVGLLSIAINNVNAALVEAYNAYAPSTAQGTGLSSVVKTNGIARDVPTYSTVDLLVTGQAGTTVYNGVATDDQNQSWVLPTVFTFPYEGQLTVTATAATLGAVTATAGSITNIATPQLGWQTVTNPNDASVGQPVESDPQLKARQTISTALPSLSLLEGLRGGLAAVSNAGRVNVTENDTDLPDTRGLPAHSIAAVAEGGDLNTLANILRIKKDGGVSTYGSLSVSSVDSYGVAHSIGLSRPTYVPVTWSIRVRPLSGYTSGTEDAIKAAVAAYTVGLSYEDVVSPGRAYVPANLVGTPSAASFIVESIICARDGMPFPDTATDLPLAWNELAQCTADNVTVVASR